jgi:hypothetical protein
MKKILTIIVLILAVLGLVFANSIIPSVGVRDVSAYPFPNTPTYTPLPTSTPIATPIHTPVGPMPPDYPPNNYIVVEPIGPSGALDIVCGDCIGYVGGYSRLGSQVNFRANWGIGHIYWTGTGHWIGNLSNGKPVYRAYPDWYDVWYNLLGGCIDFYIDQGIVKNLTIDDPNFYIGGIQEHVGSTKYCIMLVPDILRDNWH